MEVSIQTPTHLDNHVVTGKWYITYTKGVPTEQSSVLHLNEDGSFLQTLGDYRGRWIRDKGALILQFTTLTLARQEGPICLTCELDSTAKNFHGCKSHPDYHYGSLYYKAKKL